MKFHVGRKWDLGKEQLKKRDSEGNIVEKNKHPVFYCLLYIAFSKVFLCVCKE